jgi:hypothetical protein
MDTESADTRRSRINIEWHPVGTQFGAKQQRVGAFRSM